MKLEEIIKKHLKKAVNEKSENHITDEGTYMVLSNLIQMKNDIEKILSFKNHPDFPKLVTGEHAWAGDHITTSKDDIEEVTNFMEGYMEQKNVQEASSPTQQSSIAINMKKQGKSPKDETNEEEEIDESKNCPTDPAKWAASKAAAKRKFDVYPSAYANGWAAKNYKAKGGGWRKCK
jgi:hypothetical protein